MTNQNNDRIAADPEAEDDNSPKAETSLSLVYLGFGVPLAVVIATAIFGVVNGYAALAIGGFAVVAILLVVMIVILMRIARANRHRSHH